ncbi:hypothetical protein HAX54_039478 [Datura stramonium]|uniref:F-box domain-containing protein n=1 Tax=Datura stramonium TaxID=4076 RepID=A0ABS8SJ90_DATST|nr:hypothetical protein [Datura stramonium]
MLPIEELPVFDESSHQRTNFFLPTEVIFEILSRLPVKSLLKFKSVSKSWLSLISSPEFIKSHLNLSANNKEYTNHRLMLRISQPEYNLKECPLKSLFYDEYVIEESNLEDYPMKNSSISFSIEGSVNGLICLATEEKELFLWNPSIRKYKRLPDFRTKFMNANCFTYGFGYDEIHSDYKIVRVFNLWKDFEVNIYSLKNDSWRRIDCSHNVVGLTNSGKFVNGKLHWATTTHLGFKEGWSITSFDLADEKWRKVERPYYGEEGDGILMLGVLGSDLCMICNNPTTNQVDVWAMKEYGVKESWIKMFTVDYTLGFVDYFYSQSYCFAKRDHELLLMFESTFMVCNTKDNSIIYPQSRKFDFGLSAEIYIQSLVCPLSQIDLRIQQE